jgi:chemotaxis protein MotB
VSAGEEETKAQELVIIRRPLGGEDAPHKGGVWKIAYADFMTAMMAFFLVMWLINASDKQTLTQVATYFNPLHLTDKVALSKGVHQSDAVSQSDEKSHGNPKQPSGAAKDASEKKPASSKLEPGNGKGESRVNGAKPKYTEEVLFRDPYGVLSKLAKEATEDQSQAAKGGDAFRDPFDPVFRRETHAGKKESAKETVTPPPGQGNPARTADTRAGEAKQSAAVPQPATPVPPAEKTQDQISKRAPIDAAAPPADVESKTPGKVPGALPEVMDPKLSAVAQPPPAPAQPSNEAQAQKAREEAAERAAAKKLESDIRDVIARSIAGALPNISVTVTAEGLLISLTDDQNFGMFAIASAEPRPAMVVLMEKLGRVIAGYPEPLVVRGHTDGRPYKGGNYDNWRLSSARAHMAYYMLVRGGVDEKRFERIEGHADRNLKVPDDPEAAQNRRIEILLRKPKP